MDTFHRNFAEGQPSVVIDNAFKHELLASSIPASSRSVEADLHSRIGSSGLLDLPNEILLCILEQLEDELYTLACLSRRLHHLALPIYLARKGVSPFTGELILFDERSEEVVHALTIALFNPALRCINCTFNFYQPRDKVLRDFQMLKRLIGRLSVLEEAHLDLRVSGGVQNSENKVQEMEDFRMVEKECAREFRALFDSILGKGCKTLTVCIVGWCTPATPNELLPAVWEGSGRRCLLPRLLPANGLLHSWANAVQRIISAWDPFGSKHSYARAPILENFSLHCPMLLQSQYLPWTLRTLNGPNLSTLSLRYLDIYPESWSIILPRLSLKNLLDLTVDSCSIAHQDLTCFLRRHTSITHLYLGRSLALPSNDTYVTDNDILPELTHLSATSPYLRYLLGGDALPKLEVVSAINRVRHSYHFDFDALDNGLFPISRRLRQVEFSLQLSVESGAPDWMHYDSQPSPLSPTASPKSSIIPHISEIELRLGLYRLPSDVVAALPRWLRMFPGLKTILFRTPSTDGPTDPADRQTFLASLYKKCPGLERIGINGVVDTRQE